MERAISINNTSGTLKGKRKKEIMIIG